MRPPETQVFITPCIWYILTIIGQYDDRLQAKQRAAKVEKAEHLGFGAGVCHQSPFVRGLSFVQ